MSIKIFNIKEQKKQGNSRKTSTSASLTTLKPLCGSQEATIRTLHGTTDWFEIGKEV